MENNFLYGSASPSMESLEGPHPVEIESEPSTPIVRDNGIKSYFNKLHFFFSCLPPFLRTEDFECTPPDDEELSIMNKNIKLGYIFNILLVKVGARPSTLIDIAKHLTIILEGGLIDFIYEDVDLKAEELRTQKLVDGTRELWIYNQKYDQLFKKKDISACKKETIHKIRGERLGYDYPNYFLAGMEETKLSWRCEMFLATNNHSNLITPFYHTLCPPGEESAKKAVNKKEVFALYADMLGLDVIMTIGSRSSYAE